MKKINSLLFVFACLLAFASCTPASKLTKAEMYPGLYQERPHVIAVMPPINKTNNVESKEFLYYTLSQPICERGYYVISPLLCMEMFKEESAYDAEMYINGSMKKFKEVLGADAVLFTTITKWEKQSLASTIKVEIDYVLKSTTTDEILFHRHGTMVHNINTGGNSLLGMVVSAVVTASKSHINTARDCNAFALSDISAGKYSPHFDTDQQLPAGPEVFQQAITKN